MVGEVIVITNRLTKLYLLQFQNELSKSKKLIVCRKICSSCRQKATELNNSAIGVRAGDTNFNNILKQ